MINKKPKYPFKISMIKLKKKLSHKQLAAIVGLKSAQQISNYISGRCKPAKETQERFVAAFPGFISIEDFR